MVYAFFLGQTDINGNTSPRNHWHHSMHRTLHWLGPLLIGRGGDFDFWMNHFESLCHTDYTHKHCQSRLLEHSSTHKRTEKPTEIGQHKSIYTARKENAMYIDFQHWTGEINYCLILQRRKFKPKDTEMLFVR